MRIAILTLAVLFTALPAHAWGAKKWVNRHSLNVLVRRLRIIEETTGDPAIEESARKALYLLEPLEVRFGKVKPEKQIQLDSTDEQGLVMRSYGLAAEAEVREEFWREVWNAPSRWVWSKIKGALFHYLPWTPIGVWAWMAWRRMKQDREGLKRAAYQWDRGVDKLDDKTRRAFKGPDMEREHARFKAGG